MHDHGRRCWQDEKKQQGLCHQPTESPCPVPFSARRGPRATLNAEAPLGAEAVNLFALLRVLRFFSSGKEEWHFRA